MKSRMWIVLALVGLLVGGLTSTPAMADTDCFEWSAEGGRKGLVPPDGDGDNGGDVEGDPENWLGGQNRAASSGDASGDWSFVTWFQDLLDWFSGWLR